jgi:DNA-binding NtrC family response regulator
MQILEDYQWPGNVRELKNTIERAIVVCQQKRIGPQDILLGQQPSTAAAQPSPSNNSLAQVERNEIVRVLIENNGNRARSAQRLGINRKTLREKIAKYGITVN